MTIVITINLDVLGLNWGGAGAVGVEMGVGVQLNAVVYHFDGIDSCFRIMVIGDFGGGSGGDGW